ncbi:MAG: Actinorhodin polyketide putative beta-ketoacyl synthase 1 [Acidobacteria bacterium ADurb.Bin051]|nr:MAG: Actinorhodin polyketide putative beta-ketoacyl synthase 1 [Acidobacteria bacterium ADurb.Bin051]
MARPFDRRRSGVIASEGATVAVLESAAAAAARGARARARLLGAWGGCDPSAPPLGWGRDPARLAATARRGLTRHGATPAAIDRVVAAAAGTPAGDRLEAGMLRALFPERLPPVLAPKGTLGEFGGGLLAAAILAAGGEASWPTAGFAEPDPALALVPHDGTPLPAPRLVFATALAVAGGAAWALLSPP